MTNQALQLAFITQNPHSAEAIKQAAVGRGWQLLPFECRAASAARVATSPQC